MKKNKIFLILIVLVVAIWLILYEIYINIFPYKIAIIADQTWHDRLSIEKSLNWLTDIINKNNWIRWRKIKLIYFDTNKLTIQQMWDTLLKSDDINYIVWPMNSDDSVYLSDLLYQKNKIIISYSSTAWNLYRRYAGKWFYRRTVPWDVGQIKEIVKILAEKWTKKITLLYYNNIYWETFYEWIGFFALEYWLEIVDLIKYDDWEDLKPMIEKISTTNPDYVVSAIPSDQTIEVMEWVKKTKPNINFFMTDINSTQNLITKWWKLVENIEWITPTNDPTTWFFTAYKKEFWETANDYEAISYDALLLAIYTIARQQNSLFEDKFESLKKIVNWRWKKTWWDRQEILETIDLIQDWELPDISGASWPLDYDKEKWVDPIVAYYNHWRIEDQAFRNISTLVSKQDNQTSISDSNWSIELSKINETQDNKIKFQEKKSNKALIVAASQDWENYRHQSDALKMYHLLKNNWFNDDEIVVLSYDDIPRNQYNPIRWDIHNTSNWNNLRKDAIIDYSWSSVTPQTFENILLWVKTPQTPIVFESDENTNILIYIVNHAEPGSVYFYNWQFLSNQKIKEILSKMYAEKRYRQILFLLDVCFGESVLENINLPWVIMITWASKYEPSYWTTYDIKIKQWLSNEFSKNLFTIIENNPNVWILELYYQLYKNVSWSHVKLLNDSNYGDSLNSSIKDFIYIKYN